MLPGTRKYQIQDVAAHLDSHRNDGHNHRPLALRADQDDVKPLATSAWHDAQSLYIYNILF